MKTWSSNQGKISQTFNPKHHLINETIRRTIMANELSARVVLQEKVRLTGHTRSEPPVVIDYLPPLGDGAGWMPLELLLLSLAGCSGQTLLAILRKMEQPVRGLEVHAHGERRDEHPMVFTTIALEFSIFGVGVDPAAVDRAIALSEERYCPVWAMLKTGTTIKTSFYITEV
jgi:putative redox protein